MKKYITITIIIAVMIFLLTGCKDNATKEKNNPENNDIVNEQIENTNKQQESTDDLYFKVLKNEIKYINESKKETLFSQSMEKYKESSTDVKVKYTIFDFDNDSENEMIIMIDAFSDGFYLILNNEDGIIYGFEDVYRGMISIKTDGSYSASGGATTGGIFKTTFEKNKRTTKALAEMDMGKCKIDGKSVSESEYLQYFEQFKNKEDVQFITYTEKYDFSYEDSNNN